MALIRSLLAVVVMLVSLSACYSGEEIGSEPERVMDRSSATAQRMFSDPDYAKLVELSTRAKGIMVFPDVLRAAFIFGARGGSGVLMVRDEAGAWSGPAFYTIGGVNWGLQAGGQSQEIIIVIMTEKGLNAIMNRRATLGADLSVAAGELGTGLNAATGVGLGADMYAYSRSSGLFVGISLDGSVIWPRTEYNEMLYGAGATPQGILFDKQFTSDRANALVEAMP